MRFKKPRLMSCPKQLGNVSSPWVCPRAGITVAHSRCGLAGSYWNGGCLRDRRLVGSKIVIAQLNLNRFLILKNHWKAGSEVRDAVHMNFEILIPLEKYLVRSSSVKS